MCGKNLGRSRARVNNFAAMAGTACRAPADSELSGGPRAEPKGESDESERQSSERATKIYRGERTIELFRGGRTIHSCRSE